MSIEGYYYDEQRKRYFRIQSTFGGRNQLTKDHLKPLSSAQKIESYHRLDSRVNIPQTLQRQEINLKTKYNLREEVIRSQLKTMKTFTSFDLEILDFCGNRLKNCSVHSVLGLPFSDKLFAVLTGDSGSVIYQISVEDFFDTDFNANEWKRVMNAFPNPNRVIDISYAKGLNYDSLATLVHHFPDPLFPETINTSFTLSAINDSLESNLLRQSFEFSEPLFSATHFEDMNVLGAEKKVYVFKPTHSGRISMIRFNENVTALKTGSNGKYFIAGTNRGQLCCFDIRDNYSLSRRSSLSLHDKSVVFLHILEDNHSVISSSHCHNILLTDLRMFDKPVLQYYNHSNDCSKIALSVDQSVDLLCSSGDDSLVRFWSIKSGKLLHMYNPAPITAIRNALPSEQPVSRVWYSNSWKCLQNQSKHLLFSMAGNKLNAICYRNTDFLSAS